jgi:hypothetical protein
MSELETTQLIESNNISDSKESLLQENTSTEKEPLENVPLENTSTEKEPQENISQENTSQENVPPIIVNLLINLLSNSETLEKNGFKLTQSEIDVLTILLKSNSVLIIDTQISINKILSNNNINLSDLPELLLIQRKLIDVINNLKNINRNDIPQISGNLLKFIIRFLIKENIIVISNSDEFVTNFDNLVDSVTELVTFFTVTRSPFCNINWNLFKCTK